ncbi:5'-nucleotidase C-terminal domain-containing protein [Flavobacterium sp. F-380]|uniref:5'-nucleotidase C-terminal domain-containing protein n=1 Tax=Flavobacterium kayseriense TaxID=2764714 RepID=A0ABR7JB79_9FLAO|nr:5'-nucleotidase [Flavobacterium kayseriense]MBC5842717.1 5'-nucleotidase C-terminal domain-containing protein [Flavobacterium kayseriense]MBC5849247.1 5'-nucleotidase C-terminal domain-containing protein [Flavobacterium kayseriense]MBU0941172.1 5'-nucleotidase C-terminal domain-containing protein [Bacteroidota bacterium]
MVNLKKYNDVFKLFVIFLTFSTIVSCSNRTYTVTRIEGKQLPITAANADENDNTIENYISPYRSRINKDLDSVLAFCPVTLDKKAINLQSTIGNMMADVVLEYGNKVFEKRENKSISICILNNGGIRAILPKGNVTARNGFEIMPFENSLVVIALRGREIRELIAYFVKERQAHPLAGLTFTIDKNNVAKNILVQGNQLQDDSLYYVGTNDYLANGGDNMSFFSKGEHTYDLDYKLRNILIDYFKNVTTVTAKQDSRIIVE